MLRIGYIAGRNLTTTNLWFDEPKVRPHRAFGLKPHEQWSKISRIQESLHGKKPPNRRFFGVLCTKRNKLPDKINAIEVKVRGVQEIRSFSLNHTFSLIKVPTKF
jgi:hypothetical protein